MGPFPPSALPLAFFGLGDSEMLLVLIVALIFFGGEKLPEVARGFGKVLREFKKATGEVEREFRKVMDEAENPSSTLFKTDLTQPPQSRPYVAPPPLPVESEDPRDAKPAAWPAPRPESKPPPGSSTHRLQQDGETEFHSDI